MSDFILADRHRTALGTMIYGEGLLSYSEMIVGFKPDGTIEFGEKYRDNPDAAAQAFMEFVCKQWPELVAPVDLLRKVYIAGFNSAGEGFNGEYGADIENPGKGHPLWQRDMDEFISSVIPKPTGGKG